MNIVTKSMLMAPGVVLVSIGANCVIESPLLPSGYFLVILGVLMIMAKYAYTNKKYEEEEE